MTNTVNIQKSNIRKMISFDFDISDIASIKDEIKKDGWSIVHLSNRGKNFTGILEKNFIRYDENNNPAVYIPARKNFKWYS